MFLNFVKQSETIKFFDSKYWPPMVNKINHESGIK
jgi:hypothetical protein